MSAKTKPCMYCAEPILVDAKVCKHCGRDQVKSKPGSRIGGLGLALLVVGVVFLWLLGSYDPVFQTVCDGAALLGAVLLIVGLVQRVSR